MLISVGFLDWWKEQDPDLKPLPWQVWAIKYMEKGERIFSWAPRRTGQGEMMRMMKLFLESERKIGEAKNKFIGVGMPAWILLNQFGKIVYEAFGAWPYLVGSAAMGKQWRDVDVRLILEDAEYERQLGKIGRPEILNRRWSAMCLAFSILGKQVTGLPIDFQIQRNTDANAKYPKEVRHALILCADELK
jgi:predicted nucleotidyltransferase